MNYANHRTPAIDEAQLAAALTSVFSKSDIIHGALGYERADGHYMHGGPPSGVPSIIYSMGVHLSERHRHPGLLLGEKRYTPMVMSAANPQIAAHSDVREFTDALKTEGFKSAYYIPIRDHAGRLFVSGIGSRTRKISETESRLIQSYCLEALENVVKELEPAPIDNLLLTLRERECLVQAARGFTEKQAGKHLSISPFTVRAHIQSAKYKLGACTKLTAILKSLSLSEIFPAEYEAV